MVGTRGKKIDILQMLQRTPPQDKTVRSKLQLSKQKESRRLVRSRKSNVKEHSQSDSKLNPVKEELNKPHNTGLRRPRGRPRKCHNVDGVLASRVQNDDRFPNADEGEAVVDNVFRNQESALETSGSDRLSLGSDGNKCVLKMNEKNLTIENIIESNALKDIQVYEASPSAGQEERCNSRSASFEYAKNALSESGHQNIVTSECPEPGDFVGNDSASIIEICPINADEKEEPVCSEMSLEIEALNESNNVVLLIPADLPESAVNDFILENAHNLPESFVVKREAAACDNNLESMNGLDVLVELAVGTDEMQQTRTSAHMPVSFPHVSIRKDRLEPKICRDTECNCLFYHCQLCQPGLVGVFSKSVMRIHYDFHRKKGTQYGEYDINVCKLDCQLEPHMHCPLCGITVQLDNKSVSMFLSHMAACVEKVQSSNEKQVSDEQHVDDGFPPASTMSILVPHVSIQPCDDRLREVRCDSEDCNCGFFHCPLCSIDKQQFKYECKGIKHLDFHMNHSIIFNGYRIMICLLPCCVYSHYHCPLCGNTFQRKCDLKVHVTKRCKGPSRKRKKKSLDIDIGLLDVYSASNLKSVAYLKRIEHDETRGIIAMSTQTIYPIDLSQIPCVHVSIIHEDTTIHPTLCVESDALCDCGATHCLLCQEAQIQSSCKCGLFHCVLCPTTKLKASRIYRLREHIHSHYKKAVRFRGHLVLPCGLSVCAPEKQTGFHYHCPQCGIITYLMDCFRRHLYSGCKIKDTYFRFPEREEESAPKKEMKTDNVAKMSSKSGKKVCGFRMVNVIHTAVKHEKLKESQQTHQMDQELLKSDLDLALPATCPSNSAETCAKSLQVLQCVSADLSEDMLRQACPSEPPRLLEYLQQYTGVTLLSHQQGVYRVKGSWDIMEKASAIILKLIELKLPSLDQVHKYVQDLSADCVTASSSELDTGDVQSVPSVQYADKHSNNRRRADFTSLDRYFNSHIKSNMKINVYCPSCGKKLTNMTNLIMHFKSKSNCLENLELNKLPNSYAKLKNAIETIQEQKCDKCGKRFTSIISCVSHVVRDICTRDDIHERMVKFGIFRESVSSIYCCPLCAYTSMGKRHIVAHYERAHMLKTIACSQPSCEVKFATPEARDWHMRIIHLDPNYNKVPCQICGVAIRKSGINYHMMSKHSDASTLPRINCDLCDYTTWSKINLRLHCINRHGKKQYKCDQCMIGFGQISKLNQHKNYIHRKKQKAARNTDRVMAQCEICNAVMFKKNLSRHIRAMHKKERNYQCHGCEKVFFTKKSRWLHNLSHLTNNLNERVYVFKCPVCQKGFNRRWWYLEHIRNAHTDNKPFQCTECGKTFRFKLLYKKHMSTHANLDSNCKVCGQTFASTWALRIHMASKHSDKDCVQCSCGEQFSSLNAYRDHRIICDLQDRIPIQTLEISEVLSDGIKYETEVVELSSLGNAGDKTLSHIDFVSSEGDVNVEHLEAAQTLESISVVNVESEQMMVAEDETSSGSEQVYMYTDNGGLVNLQASGGINLLLENTVELNDLDETATIKMESERRTVIMETDDEGRIILRTADGELLTDEESQEILMEMHASQDDIGHNVLMDSEVDNYMCEVCSVVLQSLHDMEIHITEAHPDI